MICSETVNRIYTHSELLESTKDTPEIIEIIREWKNADPVTIDPDRIRASGLSLGERLTLRNSGDRISLELHAWNLYHITTIISASERLALWLNGLLEEFMADDRFGSLPEEIIHRVYAAGSMAIQILNSQNPFRYSLPALQITEKALAYDFREKDFQLWCRLEASRCYYLLFQVKGEFAENIERALNLARRFLDVIEKTPEASVRTLRDVYNTMGIAYSRRPIGSQMENLELGIQHYLRALEIARTDKDEEDFASILNNLGLMYVRRIAGDRAENVETSIKYLDEALQIHTVRRRFLNVAQTLTNLGVSCCERLLGDRQANLLKAIDYYRRALRFMDRTMHAGYRAWTLNNLGVVYQLLPPGRNGLNQEKAIRCYRKALEFRKKETATIDWLITTINLSKIYSTRLRGNRTRNCEIAIQLMDGALEVLPRDHSPLRWAGSCVCLGTLWSRRRKGDETENLQKAVAYYRMGLEEYRPETVPVETREAALLLGHVLMRLKRYDEAESTLRTAVRADEFRYQQMFMSQSRSIEIETGSEVYYLLADALARQNRGREAIEWLERGKTRMLAERLRLDSATFEELPDRLKEEYTQLTTELQSLRIQHYGVGVDFNSVIERTRNTRDRLENLIASIRSENRHFMPDPGDMVASLPPLLDGRCIIEYDVTAHGTVIFLMAKGKDAPLIHTTIVEHFTIDKLHAFIQKWTSAAQRLKPEYEVGNRHAWGDRILRLMRSLSTHLLEPVEHLIEAQNISEIVIVPHLSLQLLPLHLMPLHRKGKGRLLLDQYTISYLPGLMVGTLERKKRTGRGQRAFVGISNPTGDLAWADREIDEITDVFAGSSVKVLRADGAGRDAVTQAIQPADYVHFACHARFDARDPYRSFLALAAQSQAAPTPALTRVITHTIQSEPLYLGDIYRNVRFERNPLVILSCCESGLTTESIKSDEFVGFTAGFMGSGARAVMTSLWRVDDQATCSLMRSFYRNHIESGMTMAESLRMAQLETRRIPQFASPFYWAAFKIHGF